MDAKPNTKNAVPPGLAFRINLPSTLAGIFGAGIAVYYGALILRFPGEKVARWGLEAPASLWTFVGLAVAAVLAATVLGDRYIQSRLGTLKQLERGALPPSKEHLQEALRESFRTPDLVFWVGIVSWALGASFVGFGLYALRGDVNFALAARISFLGFVFGPMTSLFAHILVTLRARWVAGLIARAGLAPRDVVAAAPGRRQLRSRLVAFCAITVLVPVFLVGDVSLTLSRGGVERVLKAPVERRVEVAREVRFEVVQSIVILGGLIVVLALASSYFGGSAIGLPMREIAEEASRIAEGEIRQARAILAEDEVWAVSAAFTGLHNHVSEALGQLRRAGLQIASTTDDIVGTSAKYEAGTNDQATALNETFATTEELARSGRHISDKTAAVEKISRDALSAAQAGQKSAQAFATALARMREDNEATARSVGLLSRHIQEIGKIVEFIKGVADKSDLLALSADLEGTRAAHEVGRGFGLVAGEIRRLAENVVESTREIEELIEEIRSATGVAAEETEEGLRATAGAAAAADTISASLRDVHKLALETSEAIRQISVATQQQQQGTDQLAEAMAGILSITEQGATLTRQVVASNAELMSVAKDLKEVVDRFTVRAEPG